MTKDRAKENLAKLVKKFETELARIKDYNEEATKTAFIQPLLKDVLGWDVTDRNEVSPEESASGGRVDYGLKVDGKTKIFVEAKPPKAKLDKYIEQAVGYGYNIKDVPIVVLTDFEELKIFDVTLKPDPKNRYKGLKHDLHWSQYLERFDTLWLISKESAVNEEEFNKLLFAKPKDRLTVDKAILDDLKTWSELLAKNIFKNNPELFKSDDKEKGANFLREITQRILDRIIFMRFCEDRNLTHRRSLKEIIGERADTVGTQTMLFFKEEFMQYNVIFDSDLFSPKPEWENNLKIDFKVMREIVSGTYSPYLFDVIPIDVLGNIYEQYLGYTIRLTDHQVKYELKPKVRKAGGVYYTPEYIVDYIVKNTVGKLLQELPPDKVKKLKILDPACGSGSFLIRAYEEMLRYYRNKIHPNPPLSALGGEGILSPPLAKGDKGGFETTEEVEPKLTIQEKAKILREHIFGVDIDEQAVEVTKLSLMLKMLEDEHKPLFGRDLLPMLDRNIKWGNSLISGSPLELKKYFGEDFYNVKPFNWEVEFREIMKDGGFDVVIGNPPWIQSKFMNQIDKAYYEDKYATAKKQYDIFNCFIERATYLLRKGGLFGYIVPSRFVMNPDYELFRKFLVENVVIDEIVDVGEHIFEGVEMPALLLFFRTRKPSKTELKNLIKVKIDVKNLQDNLFKESLIPQERFVEEKGYLFTIYQPTELNSIFKKIEKLSTRFGNLVDNARGVEIGKRSNLVSETPIKNSVKFLIGEDIERYYIRNHHHLKLGDKDTDYKDSSLYQGEKILIRKTGTGINATLDTENYYVIQVIYIFKSKVENYDHRYLLGFLNSNLTSKYYFAKFGEERKKAFPHLRQTAVLDLPIRTIDFNNPAEKRMHDELVELVELMLDLNKKLANARGSEKEQIQRQIEKTDREIDELVYRLYNITDEEKKIIEGV